MEIRNLKTFLKVAALCNFTKAAKELGYSQSNVSAQIQQLEQEIGVPLFDRSLGLKQPDELPVTLTTLMQAVAEDRPLPTGYGIIPYDENLDFIPANIEMSAFEVALVSMMSREYVLRETLMPMRDRYDYILIDCMP